MSATGRGTLIALRLKRGCCQKFELSSALQEDQAYCHLAELAAEMRSGGVAIRTIVAPAAKTCSQKIASLQAGIKVPVVYASSASLNVSALLFWNVSVSGHELRLHAGGVCRASVGALR